MAESRDQNALNKALFDAAEGGDIQAVKESLEEGADINCRESMMLLTPIHYAADKENLDLIEILIKSKALVNAADKIGRTPLHYAASGNADIAVADLLIQCGADINARDFRAKTPLDLANENYKDKIVALIQAYMAGKKEVPRKAIFLQPYVELKKILDNKSTYESFDMRIMVVGKYGVGKTTLVMMLIGENLPDAQSPTDGISLIEGRIGLDMTSREWILINKDSYNAKDVLYNRMLKNPTTNNKPQSKSFVDRDSLMSFNSHSSVNKENDTGINRENLQLQKTKVKNRLSKAEFKTKLELALKNGSYKMQMGRLIFWDFGGQYVYYTTHQTFMTYRALFVVVFDGSKDLNDLCSDDEYIPGQQGNASQAVFLLHWVNSILTYCKLVPGEFPKILFVATHKDGIPKESIEERRKSVFDAVDQLFQEHESRSHLVLQYRTFVDARDKYDPEAEKLKEIITELTFQHPCWGEKMPNAWVPLELEIAELVDKGEQILSFGQLMELNKASQVFVLNQNDLKSFLLIQHSMGKMVYFDTPQLRDFVIISPIFMVEVMKSFVTDKQFWPTDDKGKASFEMMSTKGVIQKKELFSLWEREQFAIIYPYRNFIYEILVHLDIISEQRRYDVKTGGRLPVRDLFVPCMLTSRNTTNYLEQKCVPQQSVGLAFAFSGNIVPPALPNRLVSACLNTWAVKQYQKTMILFSGLVVLTYDNSHDIVICIDSNRILLFVVHERSKGLIVRDVATRIRECIQTSLERISDFYQRSVTGPFSNRELPFHVQHACPELACYLPASVLLNKEEDICCSGHARFYEIDIWYQNKEKDTCEENCEGLSEDVHCIIPSDPELLRLSQQFDSDMMRTLAIHLGISAHEWDDMRQNYPLSIEIVKFLILIKWREKKTGTFKDVFQALTEMKENRHKLCHVRRSKMGHSDIPEEYYGSIPTDEILDALAPKIGLLSFQLGVELGKEVTELETIQYNHKLDLVSQSREILHSWRNEKTVKATYGVLEQALVNVGRGSLCLNTVINEIGVRQYETDIDGSVVNQHKTDVTESGIQQHKTIIYERLIKQHKTGINEISIKQQKEDIDESDIMQCKTEISESVIKQHKSDIDESVFKYQETNTEESMIKKRKTDIEKSGMKQHKPNIDERGIKKHERDIDENVVIFILYILSICFIYYVFFYS